MPKCPVLRLNTLHPHLDAALQEFEINTPARAAAFLGQIAHESGELRWMSEIWGPTAQQRKYEPPSDLAKRLGNTEPGDGYRYRGRGVIQLTGRANYRAAGKALGVNYESEPDAASTAPQTFRVAGWYWDSRKLNTKADAGDYDGITRAINGGLNGKADRDRYHAAARKALGIANA